MIAVEDTRPLPQAILFVCRHNVIRSPMAEALMRLRHGKRVWTASCGVSPGECIDLFAAEVMRELDVDLRKHWPRSFEDLDDVNFDLIITLAPEAHHRALEYTRTLAIDVEYWPTLDPSFATGSRTQRLDEYRSVRDQIDRKIAQRFDLGAKA